MKRKRMTVLSAIIIACVATAGLSCKKEEGKVVQDTVSTRSGENTGKTETEKSGETVIPGYSEGKTEEKSSGETTSGTLNYSIYVGSYRIQMSGFTGILTIAYQDGRFSGTIHFDNWGKNIPQELKDLKIKDKKIYFIRSITSEEEKVKYGSSRFFQQTYYGIFSDDGKMIRGYFKDSGAEYKWEARR